MILAIDIGNTNIVIGCIDGERVCFVERVSTNLSNTELEYVVEFRTLFDLYDIGLEDISGSIISSVVPPINNIVKSALEKLFHKTPLLVGPGLKTGLNISSIRRSRRYIWRTENTGKYGRGSIIWAFRC